MFRHSFIAFIAVNKFFRATWVVSSQNKSSIYTPSNNIFLARDSLNASRDAIYSETGEYRRIIPKRHLPVYNAFYISKCSVQVIIYSVGEQVPVDGEVPPSRQD